MRGTSSFPIRFTDSGDVDIHSILQFAYYDRYDNKSAYARISLFIYTINRVNELQKLRRIPIPSTHKKKDGRQTTLAQWVSVTTAKVLAQELGIGSVLEFLWVWIKDLAVGTPHDVANCGHCRHPLQLRHDS
jgi:hypothetical protein